MSEAAPRFSSPAEVVTRLAGVQYLVDERIGTTVYLADRLGKPVLVEGPAGTGKTELAKAVAAVSGARLVRLQCHEGLDEAKALYEWDYRKQRLALQLERGERPGGDGTMAGWGEVEAGIFSEPFLLERPLLQAIRATDPVVLLIDEVDRVEVETEALLLEVLAEYQVS
ncbi:MAG: AAA family ATPase, partial [Acidimicrobiales bacterium]